VLGAANTFVEQELSNSSWQLARADIKSLAAVARVLIGESGGVGKFGAQGLSNTAWAIAKLFYIRHPMQIIVHCLAIR